MNITRDIQANPAIGERGLIDVYLPDPANAGPHPFVLVVHGGGWCNGDRHSQQWVVPRLIPHGFAAVLCSYRLAQEAKFPAAYDDLVHLLRWLKTHGASHGLDAHRAAMLGGSAGGHLISLLACRASREETGLMNVRAVVAYCPVADMRAQHAGDVEHGRTVASDFLGGAPDDCPQAYEAASPIDHVHAKAWSITLIHGDKDSVVPFEPARQFGEALKRAGVDAHFHTAPGRDHTMVQDIDETPLRLLFEPTIIAYLSRRLGRNDEV